ncbi:hypothetical protein [Nostoc sp. ChiVER01]|uniref:hypothetical protein n=1 Tax=unclassified Nostoc TaxID=2593658 RepID=UPI003A0FE829
MYEEIQAILDVSLGSITTSQQAYEQDGINGLCLNYKGRKSDRYNHLDTKAVYHMIMKKD